MVKYLRNCWANVKKHSQITEAWLGRLIPGLERGRMTGQKVWIATTPMREHRRRGQDDLCYDSIRESAEHRMRTLAALMHQAR